MFKMKVLLFIISFFILIGCDKRENEDTPFRPCHTESYRRCVEAHITFSNFHCNNIDAINLECLKRAEDTVKSFQSHNYCPEKSMTPAEIASAHKQIKEILLKKCSAPTAPSITQPATQPATPSTPIPTKTSAPTTKPKQPFYPHPAL